MNSNQIIRDLYDEFDRIKEHYFLKPEQSEFEHFFQQVPSEWEEFLDVLKDHTINNALEIGTFAGGSWFILCQIASSTANLISVDLGWGNYLNYHTKLNVLNSMTKDDQKALIIDGDSRNQKTFKQVKSFLDSLLLDYLLIDGGHSYDIVKSDFDMYSPLVRQGGIVIFHDLNTDQPAHEVDRFWNEIRNEYHHKEIIDQSAPWGGIGILWMQ